MEKLREELRMKFDNQNLQKIQEGINIAFKQANGTKTEHFFPITSTVKVST